MTKAVDDRRRLLAEGPGRQSDGWSVGPLRPGSFTITGIDFARGGDDRVGLALRRAASGEDAAVRRAAFRARWIETGAPTSSPDEPELMIKVGVLFERIGEVVGDLEDGVGPERAAVALVDALGAIDTLDERLGDIERWLRAVARRQGVVVPAPGKGARS